MNTQKLALYNIEWQSLRVGLSFSSLAAINASCDLLEAYYAEPNKGYDTDSNKLWRIINLLNATVMGLSGQLKQATTDKRKEDLQLWIETIQERRREYQETYHQGVKDFAWDEETECASLNAAETSKLLAVYKSLTRRKAFAIDYKHMDVGTTRKELLHYIKLLSGVISTRV